MCWLGLSPLSALGDTFEPKSKGKLNIRIKFSLFFRNEKSKTHRSIFSSHNARKMRIYFYSKGCQVKEEKQFFGPRKRDNLVETMQSLRRHETRCILFHFHFISTKWIFFLSPSENDFRVIKPRRKKSLSHNIRGWKFSLSALVAFRTDAVLLLKMKNRSWTKYKAE